MARFLGVDVGAETVKAVELTHDGDALRWTRRAIIEHAKRPAEVVAELLEAWDAPGARGTAVTGRLSRQLSLTRIPQKRALLSGHRHLCGEGEATVVSIGGHGFSVLEVRGGGVEVLRENSRCSQGTGNFLRQLVERFDLTIEQAAALAAEVDAPAQLSGRCPVILKTDMTHLANLGESRARILAGLFDAVCENVQVLVKPHVSPPAVLLTGGVSRAARVRAHFHRFCERNDMRLLETQGDDALYVEALGCAAVAAEQRADVPHAEAGSEPESTLERLPPLSSALGRVRRLRAAELRPEVPARDVVLGLDIGSTGSKAVAFDPAGGAPLWEGYQRTNGDPVGAAQGLVRALLAGPAAHHRVVGFGVTGSGREIVGSLLASCYGGDSVFVLNEIAAHAEGALFYDARVDTIFEIGGQDAKYIRLAGGRVVDAAMNEACSAGTGSFIEEQGKRFASAGSVVALGRTALAAESGVALGQHCSVFMAEIIDQAFAEGIEEHAIVAGLYDSVVQNYLNRVKGSRSVGSVVFCQGMPFAADALAAAVARQTQASVIVPPSPGTVGALGICLLATKELGLASPPMDLARFLGARVERKDHFVCPSTVGCGGGGNKCRIERLSTAVEDDRRKFTWGGGCALYDKGARKKKLPNGTPDPFREREALVQALADALAPREGQPAVAMSDELGLKGLFPFFATFVHELGFGIVGHRGADRAALKRGIEGANVPFCAPMQQFHGLAAQMGSDGTPYVFLPMIRELPRVKDEPISVVCPVVQASPDILALDLAPRLRAKVISPVIDIGPGPLDAPALVESCRALASELGVRDEGTWRPALARARKAQLDFDARLAESGRAALAFCEEHGITPIVVLGRTYTIHNPVLSSNVPAILREQGALAIPIDCYPVDGDVPAFTDMFWGHGQRILRAAHQIRRTPGLYGIFCSNYSCGPDSFTTHFFAYAMDGKPFATIETDGHSGDAGTKTRVEAFLHCVRQDLAGASGAAAAEAHPRELKELERQRVTAAELRHSGELVLIPRMGPTAEGVAAALRGYGIRAESLPLPDRDALARGRRHTSGKECVPMTLTLGSLLQRLEQERESSERFVFLMPGSRGPCRFGAYQTLHKIVIERVGWKDRVRVWSPPFDDYFEGLPGGFAAVCFTAMVASDLLLEAYNDARPVERRPGAARALYGRYQSELNEVLHAAGGGDLSPARALAEVASGRLYAVTDVLARAAADFAAVKERRAVPTVAVVGEIYVRCDPFANDFVIDRLAERGIRARLAPMNEWLEYSDFVGWFESRKSGMGERLSSMVQERVRQVTYGTMARRLGWPPRMSVQDALRAASSYVRKKLEVETVLTLGGPVHEWREGHIDAVVSTGPLECMPNKIAESQFFHVAEREGLLSLTLALNGDPVDPEILDGFAYEVHARFRARRARPHPAKELGPAWALGRRAVHAAREPLARLAAFLHFPFARDAEDDPR